MKLKLAIIVISISVKCFGQTIESELIKNINQLRLQMGGPSKGLSPFVRNSLLDSAAMYHAKWLVLSGMNSHIETNSINGIKALANFTDRAAKYGSSAYAENIITVCPYVKVGNKVDVTQTAKNAFTLWKNSQGHLNNMLFTMTSLVEARIGIAIVPYNNNSYCIVMVVGANVDADGNIIN